MRRTNTITITAEGRDRGKTFLLTEMPASQGERWAARLFLALAKSGADIPDDVAQMGMAGVAMAGLRMFGGMSFEEGAVLLDEMFGCVQVIPDPMKPEVVRVLFDKGRDGDDIEEIETRLLLRKEVFALHVDFSKLVARYKSASAAGKPDAEPSTPTSP